MLLVCGMLSACSTTAREALSEEESCDSRQRQRRSVPRIRREPRRKQSFDAEALIDNNLRTTGTNRSTVSCPKWHRYDMTRSPFTPRSSELV